MTQAPHPAPGAAAEPAAPPPLREAAASAPAPLPGDAPGAESAPAATAENPAAQPQTKFEPPDAPAVRAGVMLRQVREAAGIDAAYLASALKVPLFRIEALEAGRIADLPDITFARGLASSICRHLNGDAAAVLACLPTPSYSLQGPVSNTDNAPFHRANEEPAPIAASLFSRPVLILVGLILLAAVALWLLPTLPTFPLHLGNADQPAPIASAPGMTTEAVEPAAHPLAPVAPALPALPAATPADTPAPAPAETPSAPSGTTGETSPPAADPPAAADAPLIAFTAIKETWISVRDARGKTLIDRTLQPGQNAHLSEGQLPLAVKVGNTDGVSVNVRGQPFDLKTFARGNVARFEVK
ncbi:MAG: helix-turn-helix domain-containing protein [Ottowia sp.]